jgi:hypothetical protein
MLSHALHQHWLNHYFGVPKGITDNDVNNLVRECPSLLDVRDGNQRTIVFYWKSTYDFIDLLTLKQLNVIDHFGLTPLGYMAGMQTDISIIKKFARYGARISYESMTHGQSVLYLMNYDNDRIIEFVMMGLIDVNEFVRGIPLLFIIMERKTQYGLILLCLGANSRVNFGSENIIDYFIHRGSLTMGKNRLLVDFGVMMTLSQLVFVADHYVANIAIESLYSFIFLQYSRNHK